MNFSNSWQKQPENHRACGAGILSAIRRFDITIKRPKQSTPIAAYAELAA
jgi:hypothetical protein